MSMLDTFKRVFGFDYSKDKDGKPYDMWLLKLKNIKTGEIFEITQYGNSKKEIEDFWTKYKKSVDHELLECSFYKKGEVK